ncbi:MAG: hypothetical protein CMJ54_01620 [Planctomycetaceae bacterium]|nr:hypothetical protein [Planctomycetaceae bacterium]
MITPSWPATKEAVDLKKISAIDRRFVSAWSQPASGRRGAVREKPSWLGIASDRGSGSSGDDESASAVTRIEFEAISPLETPSRGFSRDPGVTSSGSP